MGFVGLRALLVHSVVVLLGKFFHDPCTEPRIDVWRLAWPVGRASAGERRACTRHVRRRVRPSREREAGQRRPAACPRGNVASWAGRHAVSGRVVRLVMGWGQKWR